MKTIKLFSKVKWLIVTCLMLITCSPQVWAAGTAISSLNFNAPTSLPSNYTYSTTNTPDIQTFVSISCVQVSPSGGSTAPNTWSATDAAAPSGGKRWIAFQPDVDCRVTLKVASNSKSKIFYLLDKNHKTTSSYVSSFTMTNSSQWYTDWSVSLTNSTWYAIMASASKCYIASMQFVANPTYSATAGTELTQNSGTVTLTSSGTTIYYKWSTSSSAYAANAGASLVSAADGSGSSPKTVTAPDGTGTYYLYAVAKSGNYYSDVVKRNFTIVAGGGGCAATANAGADKATTYNTGVAMAATAATSGYTGAWSISSGPSTSTSQLSSTSAYNATFTPSAAGNYTLVWTVTDDNDGSCSATDNAAVTVSKANISPSLSYSSTTLTVGDNSSNPTVSGNPGSGSVSYAVTSTSPAGCITVDPSTGVVTAVEAGSGTVTATVGATTNYNGNTCTANFTVNAVAVTYTVTYSAGNADNGSAPEDSNSPYTSGSTVTVLNNTGNLVKALDDSPATFIGWNTNSDTYSGTHYDANDQFTISANTTLYPVWGFPLSYNTDGGTINDDPYPTYYVSIWDGTEDPKADITVLPTNVTKDGYTFDGWYTQNGSGSKVTAINGDYAGPFSGDYALKAIWSAKTYKVTLDDQSATGPVSPSYVTATYNSSTIASITNPTKSGYTFGGWYKAAGGSGGLIISTGGALQSSTAYTDGSGNWTNDGAVTVYAKWTANSYDVSTSLTDMSVSSGTTGTGAATCGTNYSITLAADDGYSLPASITVTIGGNSTTSGTQYAYNSSTGVVTIYGSYITGNIAITATGAEIRYTVTYNGNGRTGGSSVPTDATSYTPGQTVTVKTGSGMTRTNYTFMGWLNEATNTFYKDGQTFTITANTTLKAQWNPADGCETTLVDINFTNKGSSTAYSAGTMYTLDGTSVYFKSAMSTYSDGTYLNLPGNASTSQNYMAVPLAGINGEITITVTHNSTRPQWKHYLSELNSAATSSNLSTAPSSMSDCERPGSNTTTTTWTMSTNKSYGVFYVGKGSNGTSQFKGLTITTPCVATAKTVTFNKGTQSGATGMPANYSVTSGSKIVEPAEIPTVSNYTFNGWTSDGSTPFNFASTTISSNTTIYASWAAKTAPTQYTFSLSDPCASASPSATLSGSQSGWSYQLYKDGVASGDPKAGTGSALTWTSLGAGTYLVKTVETSTQASAQIGESATVYAGTSITSDLASSRNVNANVATSVSITATGTGLSYQWYTCNSDGTGKVAIEGKTTNSLSSYTFTNEDAPTKYICCVVTGTCGEVTSTIQTVNITRTYLLTYNANGGSDAPAAAYRAATTASLSGTTPTWSNHRFLGWNTESDGSGTRYAAGASFTMPAEATTLYAEWVETATLTWNLLVNTTSTPFGTHGTGGNTSNNPTRIASANMTDLASAGIGLYDNGKSAQSGKTAALISTDGKDNSKYVYVTFQVASNYEFVPTSLAVPVSRISSNSTWDAVLTDGTNELTGTYTSTGDGNNNIVFTNVGNVAFSGNVTLKIWAYRSGGGGYRLVTPITIVGDINYICPERPTIVKPASAKALNVYADECKTLSVEVETYNSGALTYQWKKDGANIAGANSATYTVVGSSLTVGTTYAYTCDVTEEGACATVTSPAFNVKAASPNCGYNEIANAVLTAKNSATTSNATALYQNMSNSSAPYKLDKTLPSYFGLQLSSGNFQVGDSIIFKVKINDMNISGYDDYPVAFYHSTDTSSYTPASALYIAGGQTKNTDNIYIRFVVSQAMIDAGLTNKILIIRTARVGQNHSMYEARIKRYTCPDVVMFDANTNSNWGTTSNWVGATGRGAGLPTSDVRALITKPVTVDVTNAVAGEVVIDQHSSNTGKLTIPSTGVLKVEGPITKTTNGTSLSATAVADVVIDCGETSQGALIFEQPSSGLQTKGTVNFYTKSSRVGGKLQWQYVGYPFISGYDYDYGGYYINKYSETQGGWIVMRDQGNRSIAAWDGLAISGDGAGGASMTGTFVPTTGDKEFTLTYTAGKGKGKNLIGNSWTAPIQITSLSASDFGDATQATIYIFNTGRYGKNETSGSWVTLPVEAVKAAPGDYDITVIPAFQGFQVKTADTEDKTLTLNYDSHVRPATNTMNKPLSAPARRTHREISHISLTVESDVARQRVHLLEGPDFSEAYDNGWDGDYVGVSGQNAYLYVVSPTLGKLAVDAESSLEGRIVALQSAAEKEYTFTFTGDETGYFLNDLKTENSTLISEGNSYTFTYEQGDDYNRFMISATPFAKTTPTGIEDGSLQKVDGVQKVLYKDHMYIIRGGRMFDATGGLVK